MSTEWLKLQPIPVPPLPEQQRIVDRIESLFAKLDEAKEKAQAVVDGFELRKSAILHQAFTGELTKGWREKHGKSDSDWRRICFDDAAEIKSNLVEPADYPDFPHIAPDNIEKKTGVLLEYHTIAEDGVKSGKHRFYPGQILYSKIRPYLSKVVVVDFDGLCSADMYPIEAKENTRYLWYYMLSDEFLGQASNSGSRSVLPKINQKELSKVMVQITSPDEQQAVVEILDDVLRKEQQAKDAAEAVLDQIDTMKKAILARAFLGELGTNDPKEESAEELLREIV
jgi:type I restriction enzyme S subunit